MSKRPPEVTDGSGAALKLGGMLGQGGEGAVFEVPDRPLLVAKVYHKPLSTERAEKVRVMRLIRNDALERLTAWPVDLVRDRASGRPVGVLMPKIQARKDIHNLYSPKSRRAEFQRADWRFLIRAAANTARAFAAVHDAGCVIGDVNHGGVLVAQDATVTLIDCDSFQVTHAGRRFLCEVGVETFTPPELQGRSFDGVVRTPNHDEFGLAVMVFLLLFMGRHPFAGRFSGAGDMPIARAIEEMRFPYGHRRAAAQMAPPPGTPPLLIVGPKVAYLFERAFGRETVAAGRPGAREWIAALGELEGILKPCAANASHWHHREIACPWCPMEGAIGVPLFPAIVQVASGTTFDLALLWRQIDELRHPGPAPEIQVPPPPPSAEASQAAAWLTKRMLAASLVAGLLTMTSFAFGPVMLLAAAFAFFVVLATMNRPADLAAFRRAHDMARTTWSRAEAEWKDKAGPSAFDARRSALQEMRREWEDVPRWRAGKLDDLRRNQRAAQLERFLDRFEIESARIDGIGKGRRQTLSSFGVETAADVTHANLSQVPGFGPKMQGRLLAWRADVERGFVFDPAKGVDPQDAARVEQEVLARRRAVEDRMNAGVSELQQAHARIAATRQHMRATVESAKKAYLQAKVNLDTVGR